MVDPVTSNAGVAIGIARSIYYGFQAYRYAKKGDKEADSLEARVQDITHGVRSLQRVVETRVNGRNSTDNSVNWESDYKTLESVVDNLIDLKVKLSNGVDDYFDRRDQAHQYMDRLRAIYFIKDHMPALAKSVSKLRSNQVNLTPYEILSVSDFSHLLYDLSTATRAGDNPDVNKEFREFESEHQSSSVYSVLRDIRIKNARKLGWFSKREEDKKALRQYQSFGSSVATKLTNNTPEYNPLGSFQPSRIERPVEQTERKVRLGLFHRSKPIDVKCGYGGFTLSKMNPQKARKKAEKKRNNFISECKVAGIIGEDIKCEVRSMDSPNYALFLYELDTGELIFNENSRATDFFVDYFDSDVSTARDMGDFISEYQQNFGLVSGSDISRNFMLDSAELQSLVETGIIAPVRRRNGYYALANGQGRRK